jgi:hypothetical protein
MKLLCIQGELERVFTKLNFRMNAPKACAEGSVKEHVLSIDSNLSSVESSRALNFSKRVSFAKTDSSLSS